MNMRLLYIATIVSIFFSHFLNGMEAPPGAQKSARERRAERNRYIGAQTGLGPEEAKSIRASWRSHRESRFLKCSDYVTDAELAAQVQAENAKWARVALDSPEFRVIRGEMDCVTGVPYYPPQLCYAFSYYIIRLEPNIGWVTVLLPSGEPDPELIAVPFGVIVGLHVNQEHQRRGFGRRILRQAMNFIREQGYEMVVLRVDDPEQHQAALHLYESEDFATDPLQEGHVLARTLLRSSADNRLGFGELPFNAEFSL